MNKLIALVIGLAFIGTAFSAESSSRGVSFKSSLLSSYVDDDGTVYHDKPVVETQVTAELSGGFYLDVVHYGQLKGRPAGGTELDTSFGWAREGSVDVDVGISYYDFATLFRGSVNNSWAAYAKVSKAFEHDTYGTLTPLLEVTHYKATSGSDFEGGFRARIGADYTHKLHAAELAYSVSVVRDDGTFGTRPAWVNIHELALGWKVKKIVVNAPIVTQYIPLSSNTGRKPETVVSVGIAFDF